MSRPMPMSEEERTRRLESPMTVYVPAEGARFAAVIHPQSGIVGEPHAEGHVLLHYEGGSHAENIRTFADRVLHAAGRAATRYPTVAMRLAQENEVVAVGSYDPRTGTVHVENEAALARWLGVERVPADELLTSEGAGKRRREIESALARPDLEPGARHWAEREARKLGMR